MSTRLDWDGCRCPRRSGPADPASIMGACRRCRRWNRSPASTKKCVGHAITRIDLARTSALKTHSPLLSASIGLEVEGVSRQGQVPRHLAQGLHLVYHLARAGWLRWKDSLPDALPKPAGAAGPAASPGRWIGLRPDQAVPSKLAIYVVTDPWRSRWSRHWSPDPLYYDFDQLRWRQSSTPRAEGS